MALISKALLITLVTVGAMLVSPLTLAAGVWIAGHGLSLSAMAALAGAAILASRLLASAIRS